MQRLQSLKSTSACRGKFTKQSFATRVLGLSYDRLWMNTGHSMVVASKFPMYELCHSGWTGVADPLRTSANLESRHSTIAFSRSIRPPMQLRVTWKYDGPRHKRFDAINWRRIPNSQTIGQFLVLVGGGQARVVRRHLYVAWAASIRSLVAAEPSVSA